MTEAHKPTVLNRLLLSLRVAFFALGLFMLVENVFFYLNLAVWNHTNLFHFNKQTGEPQDYFLWKVGILGILCVLCAARATSKISRRLIISLVFFGLFTQAALGATKYVAYNDLFRHPTRLRILRANLGNTFDLCSIIKLGDDLDDALRILSATFDEAGPRVGPSVSVSIKEGVIPKSFGFDRKERRIEFDEKTRAVAEIECFDDTRIKFPGASPRTVYEYRE
ncbi:MAG: hypothetical protein EOP06_29050 [Proteobacteria bacterium]|nr:MAG: hypothetical protein EOP06_29050 [Pseudomonadota bacterium]